LIQNSLSVQTELPVVFGYFKKKTHLFWSPQST